MSDIIEQTTSADKGSSFLNSFVLLIAAISVDTDMNFDMTIPYTVKNVTCLSR